MAAALIESQNATVTSANSRIYLEKGKVMVATATDPARRYRIGLIVFTTAGISGGQAAEPGLPIASHVVQGNGSHEHR